MMDRFAAIDFETANPKRVSACAMGIAEVYDGEIVGSRSLLMRPVGGHAAFQSKIHGIRERDTANQPDFGQVFHEIQVLFKTPLVGHGLFDKQVLNALIQHYSLSADFEYTDSAALAKRALPELRDHKLQTLTDHYELGAFRPHNPESDAIACAKVFLNLQAELTPIESLAKLDEASEFRRLGEQILADGIVSYKETCELLYWLEDHPKVHALHLALYHNTKEVLEDGKLDSEEALSMKLLLARALGRSE